MSSPTRKWPQRLWRWCRPRCTWVLARVVDRLARWEQAMAPETVEASARRRVEAYLQQVVGERNAVSTGEEVQRRADMAMRFVEDPYWALICQMLTGTIKAETEEMLSGDERLTMNRASVAMCRKFMRMPFIDIEQG